MASDVLAVGPSPDQKVYERHKMAINFFDFRTTAPQECRYYAVPVQHLNVLKVLCSYQVMCIEKGGSWIYWSYLAVATVRHKIRIHIAMAQANPWIIIRLAHLNKEFEFLLKCVTVPLCGVNTTQ